MRWAYEPWKTPGVPALTVAAVRPDPTPSPPASHPTRRTDSSSMNEWNNPIALEPPPTHATAASGSRPA